MPTLIRRSLRNLELVQPSSIATLRALPYVRRIEIDREISVKAADAFAIVGAPDVRRAFSVTGRGKVIAIIDTGIDYTHPAIRARLWRRAESDRRT